ncbi:hypothetical protein PAMA_016811 [Pampus argenteus]
MKPSTSAVTINMDPEPSASNNSNPPTAASRFITHIDSLWTYRPLLAEGRKDTSRCVKCPVITETTDGTMLTLLTSMYLVVRAVSSQVHLVDGYWRRSAEHRVRLRLCVCRRHSTPPLPEQVASFSDPSSLIQRVASFLLTAFGKGSVRDTVKLFNAHNTTSG